MNGNFYKISSISLAAAALLVIQLAACGGGGSASSSTTPAVLSAQVTATSTSNSQSSSGSVAAGTTGSGGVSSDKYVPPPPPTGPYVTASVVVTRTSPGETINSNFLGLSYEKFTVSTRLLTSANAPLVNYLNKLGHGILRIGGGSVNTTTWNVNGAGMTTGFVAPADVDRIATLLTATGWKVIYGLNHVTNSPANIASEAKYVANKLGDSLIGFEIGNEPDIYYETGARPSTYTFADFLVEWQAYYNAIIAVVPNARITGPGSSNNYKGYTIPFAQNKGSEINLLTQHYYRADGQSASSTMDLLLSADPNLPIELQKINAAAKAVSIPMGYRIDEANSFYYGGSPTVSPAYGTALWILDFLFINAENGCSGVNMHGGGNASYSPIVDNGSVSIAARPEYYGMLMFSMAANGTVLSTETTVSTINFTSYAIAQTDGSTMVLLNNKDKINSAYTSITLNQSASTAVLTTLTGTDLNSTSGYTLNGTTVSNEGLWNTGTPNKVGVSTNGTLTIVVPPMSAILVHAS
jgi:hypothetical protein